MAKKHNIESHDAAGYETALEDFGDCDDGYGNKIEHGDLSMQRHIERGGRSKDGPSRKATGYDKHPFDDGAEVPEGQRRPTGLGKKYYDALREKAKQKGLEMKEGNIWTRMRNWRSRNTPPPATPWTPPAKAIGSGIDKTVVVPKKFPKV